jgi:hypothetical protein
MHTYTKPVPDSDVRLPSIAEFRFNDALDVVAYAEIDFTIGWKTWPETWHLDADGVFQCYFSGSSLQSIVRWARQPRELLQWRLEGPGADACPNRWLIVDSRPVWLNEPPTVTEADAQAFLTLRRKLRRRGIELVDDVVFDDQGHWWSLHELTCGTTAWAA